MNLRHHRAESVFLSLVVAKKLAPKSASLRHHRAESAFSTSSWIDAGGSEISEIVSFPNEISVFELGGHREPPVVAPSSSEISILELGGCDLQVAAVRCDPLS